MAIQYERITSIDPDFLDNNALAVEALIDVWRDRVEDLRSSKSLEIFNEQLYRRWAIETGILERLYSIDRGVTEILVERGLDVSLIEHGSTDRPPDEVISILQDQRDAVQYVMDFVIGQSQLSLHFIRSLHQILTKHQPHVDVKDQFGNPATIRLIQGGWKEHPNNPTRPDGAIIHTYCPPELVQEEMESLLDMYQKMEGIWPAVVRSAWLHHRFTQIHPFQDGNGRVARALAAFVFIKSSAFPIIVEREDRGQYIDSLETADKGDLRPLVEIWSRLERRAIEGALSLSESVLEERPQQQNLLRERLLEAITARAQERKEKLQKKQKGVLQLGDDVFENVIVKDLEDLRSELMIAMRIDTKFVATIDRSDDTKLHWFKQQLMDLANVYGYYCDLPTYHRWARLKLSRSSGSEHEVDEIIISVHSLGRSFSGVLACSGYFAEREYEEGRSMSGAPRRITDRPLSFTYAESKEQVEARLRDWLTTALNVALEEFRREL